MARDAAEIEEEIGGVERELERLRSMPLRFQVHGQSVDNTERVGVLQRRLRELRAELAGRSVFQGPDLEV